MAFHVGQRVVCVNDAESAFAKPGLTYEKGGLHGLRKGRIYTVRGFYKGDNPRYSKDCIYVAEIVRPIASCRHETPFFAARFRPVVERKTDISLFLAMLNPSTKKVDA